MYHYNNHNIDVLHHQKNYNVVPISRNLKLLKFPMIHTFYHYYDRFKISLYWRKSLKLLGEETVSSILAELLPLLFAATQLYSPASDWPTLHTSRTDVTSLSPPSISRSSSYTVTRDPLLSSLSPLSQPTERGGSP